jgi:hypothetical protein
LKIFLSDGHRLIVEERDGLEFLKKLYFGTSVDKLVAREPIDWHTEVGRKKL